MPNRSAGAERMPTGASAEPNAVEQRTYGEDRRRSAQTGGTRKEAAETKGAAEADSPAAAGKTNLTTGEAEARMIRPIGETEAAGENSRRAEG